MSYRLVKGAFHLFYRAGRHVGSRPDGDSLWFQPDDAGQLRDLGGRHAELNRGGSAQLRFEAIDALELHYRGANHQLAQPTVDARDFLLGRVGFTEVSYAPSDDIATSVRAARPHPIRGHILVRGIDRYARPIAFVYRGDHEGEDGSALWLGADLAAASLNGQLTAAGHAYPSYYTSLPADLRTRFTELARRARDRAAGVWAQDRSCTGAVIRNRKELSELAIWPKAYRRLFDYFAAGEPGLGGFDAWLRAVPEERDDELWIAGREETANMHDLLEVRGDRIAMNHGPEDLVIVPR